jgi:RNA polymerase sigma-70 factor (ECF subfamily)
MLHPQPQQNSILQRKEVPDGLLVGQALAGDQYAFELLVNRYQQQLVGLIQSFLKDHNQSYDILQQVYLQLYLSLPILFTNVSLKGWLFQVARNRCLDELRKRHRRPELSFSAIEREDGEEGLSSLEAIADREPLPEEMIESSELHGSLRAAMVSLPPQLRPIAHLRCFRQLTFAEIGRTLNLPETTVKTSFYRSLPRLRRVLASPHEEATKSRTNAAISSAAVSKAK